MRHHVYQVKSWAVHYGESCSIWFVLDDILIDLSYGVITILKHLSLILSHSLNNSNNNNIENLTIKSTSKVLALPGRPERGVQLAWGFPLRSKWMYGAVFHPAVVPQPPFTQLFLRHKNRT